jgi:hypothetical protein
MVGRPLGDVAAHPSAEGIVDEAREILMQLITDVSTLLRFADKADAVNLSMIHELLNKDHNDRLAKVEQNLQVLSSRLSSSLSTKSGSSSSAVRAVGASIQSDELRPRLTNLLLVAAQTLHALSDASTRPTADFDQVRASTAALRNFAQHYEDVVRPYLYDLQRDPRSLFHRVPRDVVKMLDQFSIENVVTIARTVQSETSPGFTTYGTLPPVPVYQSAGLKHYVRGYDSLGDVHAIWYTEHDRMKQYLEIATSHGRKRIDRPWADDRHVRVHPVTNAVVVLEEVSVSLPPSFTLAVIDSKTGNIISEASNIRTREHSGGATVFYSAIHRVHIPIADTNQLVVSFDDESAFAIARLEITTGRVMELARFSKQDDASFGRTPVNGPFVVWNRNRIADFVVSPFNANQIIVVTIDTRLYVLETLDAQASMPKRLKIVQDATQRDNRLSHLPNILDTRPGIEVESMYMDAEANLFVLVMNTARGRAPEILEFRRTKPGSSDKATPAKHAYVFPAVPSYMNMAYFYLGSNGKDKLRAARYIDGANDTGNLVFFDLPSQ